MSDTIFINGLVIHAHHGVMKHEAKVGQRFAIVGEPALLEQLRPDAVLLPGVGQDWLAERGARAALLRPDRYIFAVAP